MQEVVKKGTVKTDKGEEFFELTPDQMDAAAFELLEDEVYSFTKNIETADNVKSLFKSDAIKNLAHTFRWTMEWTSITWDDLAVLLEDVKNAIIKRISAEH